MKEEDIRRIVREELEDVAKRIVALTAIPLPADAPVSVVALDVFITHVVRNLAQCVAPGTPPQVSV